MPGSLRHRFLRSAFHRAAGLVALAAVAGATPPPPLAGDGGVIYGAAAQSLDGIVYGEAGGRQLKLDYYPPAGKGPHPAVILIHGGWYHANSKAAGEIYPADFLTPAGYAVFAINFRPAPPFTLADQVDDVSRAVRFIRHHAAHWNVDPQRLVLWGGSAGAYRGNMAALLGGPGPAEAPDPVDRESARVQAVVSMYGIGDLRPIVHRPWMPGRPTLEEWAGMLRPATAPGRSVDEAATAASPLTHVSPAAPPFLLIHGTRDEAVPHEQSLLLQQRLRAAGVRCELLSIPGGLHTTVQWHRLPQVPAWELSALRWLNQTLGHDGPVGEGIRARPESAAIPAQK